MARACGRRPAIHPFIITNLAVRGLCDETRFIEGLANGTYHVAVLPFDPANMSQDDTDRWTASMLETIAHNYTIVGRLGQWNILHHTDNP